MNYPFQRIKKHRISYYIADQIRSAILKGDIKAGDRLPPENVFARKLAVSKSSLREAYRVLEAGGLLEIRKGMNGGTFVQKVKIDVVKEGLANYLYFEPPSLEAYTQFRLFNEPQIIKICAAKITGKDVEELKQNIKNMAAGPAEAIFFSDLDVGFHKKIADIAGNSILSMMIESVQPALVRLKRIIYLDSEFVNTVLKGHGDIVTALEAKDAEKASFCMLKHINEVEDLMRKCGYNKLSSQADEDLMGISQAPPLM